MAAILIPVLLVVFSSSATVSFLVVKTDVDDDDDLPFFDRDEAEVREEDAVEVDLSSVATAVAVAIASPLVVGAAVEAAETAADRTVFGAIVGDG